MWINGSPGTGKSAIASSLVSYLCSRDRLGSFFFFVRGDDNLSDPTVLWRTVAYDLARFHSCLNEAIIAFLKRPGYRDADIQLHFECMVMDALRKNHQWLSSAPPVIVLDALDECGSDDYHSAQRRILLETLTRWSRLPRSFKLIVTSRNDRVPESFYDPQICRKITLETGDSVRDETHDDIRTFLRQRLKSVKLMLGLSPWWPGDVAIDQLAKRAAGLFIWAETALVFISEKRGNPTIKLQLVLSGNLGDQSEIIDNLYWNILNFSFKNSDEIAVSLFNAVVGAVIVAHLPLSSNDLGHFLGIADEEGQRQLSAILYNLSSVMESDKVVRLRHISFAEYLCDQNRCRDRRFVVNQREQHYTMALACLRTMNADLRFNICKLKSSYVRNDDVPNLATQISACIPTRLSYACRYWAAHLCDMMSDETGRDVLLDEVRVFFSTRLLYWLEVMSLIKEIPASSIVLLMAAQWLEVSACLLLEWWCS
jgi:NACHT domain